MKTSTAVFVGTTCWLALIGAAPAQPRAAALSGFSTVSIRGTGGQAGPIKNTPCHASSGPNECVIIVRAKLAAIDEDDGDDDDSAICEIRVPHSVIIPKGYSVVWRLSQKSFGGKGFFFTGDGVVIDGSGAFQTPAISSNKRFVTAKPVSPTPDTTVSSYTLLLEVKRPTTGDPSRTFKCAGLDPIIVNRN